MNKKQKGFSLIELLIVVAIILIIAAIAIPNLLRARMAANESSAVGSLRTITTAQGTYSSMYGIGYALTKVALGPGGALNTCTNANLIDNVLMNGIKSGYTFPAFATTPNNDPAANVPAGCVDGAATWSENSNPNVCDQTGHSTFFVDNSGVIRHEVQPGCVAATVASLPLQ
ncbi:MAG TPA: prepilin-type N-terminal cleavage/methylation domain-containing protein [Candidatus Acidoferrales bacterium]|nr:prepilin-type N-terminal cleavage/methylation domain-containing protein [Candidatus Acidoferrales bacterium]